MKKRLRQRRRRSPGGLRRLAEDRAPGGRSARLAAHAPSRMRRLVACTSQRATRFITSATHEEQERHLRERREVRVRVGLGELVGDDAGHRVGRIEERRAHLGTVADDHGHRHRLAERAVEPEDDGADDARARRREHGAPDHVPRRRAQADRGLAVGVGHGAQHLARDRGDGRHDHDRQDDPGGQHPEAERLAVEEREEAEVRDEEGLDRARGGRGRARRSPRSRRPRWGWPRAARPRSRAAGARGAGARSERKMASPSETGTARQSARSDETTVP